MDRIVVFSTGPQPKVDVVCIPASRVISVKPDPYDAEETRITYEGDFARVEHNFDVVIEALYGDHEDRVVYL